MPLLPRTDRVEMRGRRLRRWCMLRAIALLPGMAGYGAAVPEDDLPRSAIEIRSGEGRQWFNIRIADTSARQERDLMFVRNLPTDEGMLFPQKKPQPMAMRMKNTLIPLDMLFIDSRGHIVCLIENAKPQSLEILSCDQPVKAVLEIAGGEAARRAIRVDNLVRHAIFHR